MLVTTTASLILTTRPRHSAAPRQTAAPRRGPATFASNDASPASGSEKATDGARWLAEGVAEIFTPSDNHGINWTGTSAWGYSPYSSTVVAGLADAEKKAEKMAALEKQSAAAWSLASSKSVGHPAADAFIIMSAALGDPSISAALLDLEEEQVSGVGHFIADGVAKALGKLGSEDEDIFKGTGTGWTGDIKKKTKL